MQQELETRGRPPIFCHDELVRIITEMFWSDGYKSLSINSIAKKLGLNRTSLYNSFKSKENLLLECLDYYAEQSPTAKLFQHQPQQNISGLLTQVLYQICRERANDPLKRGCLAANIYTELASDKSCAAKTILDKNEARKKKMRLIIKRAIDQQELPPNTDPEICANVILSFMNGLNAHAKSGATEQEMKRMCDFFIEKIGFVSLNS